MSNILGTSFKRYIINCSAEGGCLEIRIKFIYTKLFYQFCFLEFTIRGLDVMEILNTLIIVAVSVFCIKGNEFEVVFKNRQLFEPSHNNPTLQVRVSSRKIILTLE